MSGVISSLLNISKVNRLLRPLIYTPADVLSAGKVKVCPASLFQAGGRVEVREGGVIVAFSLVTAKSSKLPV